MVEGICLENRRPFTGSVSSNLTASAMKILGVDYGVKRIGIAVSDENSVFAFPYAILLNDGKVFLELGNIIKKEEIGKIVVGDPGDNSIAGEVREFVKKLEQEFSLPVIMEKEFMTSMHVSQASGKKPTARLEKQDRGPKRDDSAAALILQRYLDRKI